MDQYERNVYINSKKKRIWKDTGAVSTTNPARWRLGSRLRLGATSQEQYTVAPGSRSRKVTRQWAVAVAHSSRYNSNFIAILTHCNVENEVLFWSRVGPKD